MGDGLGVYDEAAKGCCAFFATSFFLPSQEEMLNMPAEIKKNFNQYQVGSGLNGTLAAIDAAQKFGLKKIIQTSSVAAISPTSAKAGQGPADEPYSEKDWNDVAKLGYMNYFYAKRMGEKRMFDWKKDNPSGPAIASLQFAVATGPPQQARIGSSTSFFAGLLKMDLGPFFLPINLWLVDIRDVARAHVHVLEHDKGEGRFVVSPSHDPKETMWSLERVSKLFISQAKFQDYPVAEIPLPMSVFRLLATNLPGIDAGILELVEPTPGFDGTKITRELGFEYKHANMTKSLIETAERIIEVGGADVGKTTIAVCAVLFAIAFFILIGLITIPVLYCMGSGDSSASGASGASGGETVSSQKRGKAD